MSRRKEKPEPTATPRVDKPCAWCQEPGVLDESGYCSDACHNEATDRSPREPGSIFDAYPGGDE